MRNKILAAIILFINILYFVQAQDAPGPDEISYRPAVNSGKYYPADPDSLRQFIYAKLDTANKSLAEAEIIGIVVPHAAYPYSGWVAARTYRNLIGKKYDAIIIIAPSHFLPFRGASIFNGDGYTTPIGTSKIDKELAKSIADGDELISYSDLGQKANDSLKEHSIEVQLPFLQIVQPATPIVPILAGSQDEISNDALMRAIVKAVKKSGKKVLIIASADLSHFHSLSESRAIDIPALETFSDYDYYKLEQDFRNGIFQSCGSGPIVVMLEAAEQLGAGIATPLMYSTSATSLDIRGDTSRVVGYFSGIVIKIKKMKPFYFPDYNDEEKEDLFTSALSGIRKKILSDSTEPVYFVPRNLTMRKGIFVTLKKNGELRGSMGSRYSNLPLLFAVENAAMNAATSDPRFAPVTAGEIDSLEFEISILSRFKRLLDTSDIEIDNYGLFITDGDKMGLLLPEVATDNNLTKLQFLQLAGKKAGLGADAFSRPDILLYYFETRLIKEDISD